MTDHGAFESRLAAVLRDYAAEAPVEVNALSFARAIAAGHPRHAGRSVRGFPSVHGAVVWAVLGMLLLLATIIAIAAVGSRPDRNDLTVDSKHSIPRSLSGEYKAQLAGPGPGADFDWYFVDLNANALIHGPSKSENGFATGGSSGAAVNWAGRAVAFVPIGAGVGELSIQAAAPCGDARYLVRSDDQGITFTRSADPCSERVAILTARPWTHTAISLAPEGRYSSWFFTEPFHFVMPEMDPRTPRAAAVYWLSPGRLRIANGYSWGSWFLDDEPVYIDVCDPSKGLLADVPATPEAVAEWLRSSTGLTVPKPVEVLVDGRTALRFDLAGCDPNGFIGVAPSIGVQRLYAIPTGDDTILYAVYSDGGSTPHDEVGAEALVRSMTFD